MTKFFKMDGFSSAVLGGRRRGSSTVQSSFGLYAQGGLFARVVDKPSDDALSGGVSIDNDDGVLMAELDRLNAIMLLSDAVRWVRLTGGACIIPVVQDGLGLDQSLPEAYGQIEELRIYAATDLVPYGERYNDSSKANYGKPMLYQVNSGNQNFIVHESRLITLSGDPLPPNTNTSNVYWQGRSAVDRPYQCIIQWIDALGKVMAIIDRKQQAVYGMQGLADAITSGLEDDVRKRVALVDEVRGILNTVTIDGADSYDIKDLNLGGLPEAVNEFKEALAAETGMPITLLFGRSAAGLNATGEGDLRGYYDMVEGIRSRTIQPALEALIAMLCNQSSIKVVNDWQINWEPLFKPTGKELAEIAKLENEAMLTEMSALEKAVQMGAISERQVLEYLQSKGLFGLSNDDIGGVA